MSYENDPYKNDSFWPEGYSQLTNVSIMPMCLCIKKPISMTLGFNLFRLASKLNMNLGNIYEEDTKSYLVRIIHPTRSIFEAQTLAEL